MDSLEMKGLEDLCLGDELTKTVAAKLGAVPKKLAQTQNIKPPPNAKISEDKVVKDDQPSQDTSGSSGTTGPQSTGSTPAPQSTGSTPAMQRKQIKKKNRKDRRNQEMISEVSSVDENSTKNSDAPVAVSTSNAKNARNSGGARRGVARSNSARSNPTAKQTEPSQDEITKLLFKSQSTVNVKTGIRNLPDSFFNDELPEEVQENNEKNKKKPKNKKKGRKKGAPVEKETAPPTTSKDFEKWDSSFKEYDLKDSSFQDYEPKDSSDKENEWEGNKGGGKDLIFHEDKAEDDTEKEDDGIVYNWRNVTKNGDVKKCILVEGNRDEGFPMKGDVVVVKSQAKLKDGTMIDDNPTLVFRVGEYEVVQGLDLCVQSMYKNELAIVSVKPEMGYGDLGRKPDIAPDSRITYLFGLLHFEKQKDISELTWGQRRKMGQSRMRIANWWYSRKEYSIAVKCYKKALLYYNNIPTDQKCSTTEEYRELLTLMEERLRVMRQVANIFKRIANLIQSGYIDT